MHSRIAVYESLAQGYDFIGNISGDNSTDYQEDCQNNKDGFSTFQFVHKLAEPFKLFKPLERRTVFKQSILINITHHI
jgi:hypothetical protein